MLSAMRQLVRTFTARISKKKPGCRGLHTKPLNGVIPVNKPKGLSSFQVVESITKLISTGHAQHTKVGHGGTLDPMATGVLVIGIGTGCKLLQSYLHDNKEYYFEAELGIETDTLDAYGKAVKHLPFDHVTREQLEAVLPKFRGTIQQVPPAYSALRINGKRAYALARQGLQVELPPRSVTINRIECVHMTLPRVTIRVECSGGTYVRSLVRDIARELGTVGTCVVLQRTRQGPYTLEQCLTEEEWRSHDHLMQAIEESVVHFALDSPTTTRQEYGGV